MKIRGEVVLGLILAASFSLRVFRGAPVDCDFTQFWAMARIPFSERANPETLVHGEKQALAGSGIQMVPYIRPMAFTIPLEPLRFVPLVQGYRLWTFVQLLCLYIFLLLARKIAPVPWAFLCLVALYSPAMHGISLGQDDALLALLLLLGLIALKKNRDGLAGLLFAASLFKFQLLWTLPVFLLMERRYRALMTLAAGGLVLAAVSCAIMPPSAYVQYVTHVGDYLPGIPPGETMRGLRGMTYPWLYWPVVALLLAIAWRRSRELDLESVFCIFLTISVFCAYYVMHHDYTLFLLPFFLALLRGGPVLKYIAASALVMPPVWDYRPAMLAAAALFCGALLLDLRGTDDSSHGSGQPMPAA